MRIASRSGAAQSQGMAALAESLAYSPALQELDISWCELTDASAIAPAAPIPGLLRGRVPPGASAGYDCQQVSKGSLRHAFCFFLRS